MHACQPTDNRKINNSATEPDPTNPTLSRLGTITIASVNDVLGYEKRSTRQPEVYARFTVRVSNFTARCTKKN